MKTEKDKEGMGRNNGNREEIAWWIVLPTGERVFLGSLMRMIRGAKRSRLAEVARAARFWESKLAFFLKWQLKRNCSQGTGVRGRWTGHQ
jgi:hypothetical protein